MSKKFLILLIAIIIISVANAEISNKFILDSKVKGKESISIATTPLTNKKQVNELKVNVDDNKNF